MISERPNYLLEAKKIVQIFYEEGDFDQKKKFVAVNNVDLSIKGNEALGIVGESGSGKTTLIKTLLRLIEPKSGRIYFKGHEITKVQKDKLRALRSKMQLVYQNPQSSLNPHMKVGNALGRVLKINRRDLKKYEIKERAGEVLSLVGLSPNDLNRYPSEFSGGQRQRINIARAIICSPELIYLDEPTSALDVSVQARILNLLNDLKEKLEIAMVFVSHDISVVGYMAERVVMMYHGQIVEDGKRSQVFETPLHPYTKSLLSALPSVDRKTRVKACSYETPRFRPAETDFENGCTFFSDCEFREKECKIRNIDLIDLGDSHKVRCLQYE